MRSEKIHPAELGGTLFVPATHRHLADVASGQKYPRLRSMVVDLEDGIDSDAQAEAVHNIAALLQNLKPATPLRFIRPSSPEMLETLLALDGIGAIDGFVLPKFGLANADAWLLLLQDSKFPFMPSIEGRELFRNSALIGLAEILLPYRERIPTVRFGLEDMLGQLGIVRDCDTALYDLIAPSHVIGVFLGVFKPLGFNVSGGVYRCYRDAEGLRREAETDLKQGLLGKTIIHPSQIDIIEEAYKVSRTEMEQAEKIVNASTNVSSTHGVMLERPTQLPWAETILRRAALYGLRA